MRRYVSSLESKTNYLAKCFKVSGEWREWGELKTQDFPPQRARNCNTRQGWRIWTYFCGSGVLLRQNPDNPYLRGHEKRPQCPRRSHTLAVCPISMDRHGHTIWPFATVVKDSRYFLMMLLSIVRHIWWATTTKTRQQHLRTLIGGDVLFLNSFGGRQLARKTGCFVGSRYWLKVVHYLSDLLNYVMIRNNGNKNAYLKTISNWWPKYTFIVFACSKHTFSCNCEKNKLQFYKYEYLK